ncbi:MAG TPA: thiamine-phosphate kinase [Terracidiphilus sp.]|nr:thiamine-phosphate kinase [Terracidiphilus sp.]
MPYLQGVASIKNSARGKRSSGSEKIGREGELELLQRIRGRAKRASGGGLHLGIGDDCALLRLRAGKELAITTDLSIEGRHFRLDWHPPEVIGHRTLARGLSDLAAMGARPVAAFLSLGLPAVLVQRMKARRAWIDRFYDGFLALAEAYQTPLAGGDLAESPVAVADIVLVGAVAHGKALLRSGARPGDSLYVTGSLGGAAAGLQRFAKFAASLRRKTSSARRGSVNQFGLKAMLKPDAALEAHLHPQPRIAQGLALVRRGLATAALDISDGLSTDLRHLCEESGVAAELDAAALPIHPGATLEQALHGGEDYELLFAARARTRIPHALAGVPVTRIGRVVRRRAGTPIVRLITEKGSQPLEARGWEHFS